MAIKVIVNYPDTPEGIELLNNSYSEAVLSILRKMLTPQQLDQLMQKLATKVAAEKEGQNHA